MNATLCVCSICSGDGGSVTEVGGSVGYGESLGSILIGGYGVAHKEHAGTAPEEQGGLEGHLAGIRRRDWGLLTFANTTVPVNIGKGMNSPSVSRDEAYGIPRFG